MAEIRRRRLTLSFAAFFILLWIVMVMIRDDGTQARPAIAQAKLPFDVPAGFVVERVAGPPLVERPMMACFDSQGSLFIAESAGKNLRKKDLLKDPPNFIRVLHGRDNNGRFQKNHIFANKMVFPMGVLPYRGSVYTASPPSLWQLRDADGDGKADRRRELVTKFGFTGNAASIHGPFLGPDGWIYWTDGRHGHEIKRRDGTIMKGKAARIFRCRHDGSDIEVVCGGGMDDPVEVAFTAEGEPLVTVDILHNRPSRNDGIIFAIEGGAYPWHRVYNEFKQTGDLLPAVADLGWVAPSGLVRYRSDALGKEYQGNLFSAQFNRGRIQRHIVKRVGASFEIQTFDFLTSTDPNFHPTDVLEDADGSLLIVDTGGWFRIGCPTSQIARPQIMGGIYRVRRNNAKAVDDPHGLKIPWRNMPIESFIALLDDPRFLVRDLALDGIARHGKDMLPALAKARNHPSTRIRRNLVWSLSRMHFPEARALVRQFLDDKDFSVRLAAARSVGLNRDDKAIPQLITIVKNDEPAVQRQAATALGRLKANGATASLLKALASTNDRFLEHALIFALIQIGNRDLTGIGLALRHPNIRRGALIALDQMDKGGLTREMVVRQLNTTDVRLQQTALNIISSRKGWGEGVIQHLRERLSREKLDDKSRQSLSSVLARVVGEKAVQGLIAELLQTPKTPAETRLLLLETMARLDDAKLPAAWRNVLSQQLRHADNRVKRQAVVVVRSNQWKEFDAELLRLAKNNKLANGMRIAALRAVAPRLKTMGEATFNLALHQLHKDSPTLLRLEASEVLGAAPLSTGQLLKLTIKLSSANALELPHLLAAFEKSSDVKVGLEMVRSLENSKLLATLSPETIKRTMRNYPAKVLHLMPPLLQKLNAGDAENRIRLKQLEKQLAGGDARVGRSVFFGKKAVCHACHAVKGLGGKIGPDLTKIGAVRSQRDLLEAVVFPSASLARGYEQFVVATKDGRVFSGMLTRETATNIHLVQTGWGIMEARIAKKNIDAMEPSRISIMPQGLERQLSPAEFRDLIAYLKSLR